MSLSAGARLGPYEIQSAVGAGGMGEVYRARDTRLNRTVAIKVLPAPFAADPQLRERFEREAKAISRLNHPHICTLYDVGHQDGTDFLVMEYLEGETLAMRLEKGALPLDQALRVGVEVADALDKAHRAGIVHRDLKPGNIIVTKTGAKLLDFGLAKATGPIVAGTAMSMLPTSPQNLTAQGTILGTFQYMAPEQLDGGEADARSDIFAFGAVLYEMLTGNKAFPGKTQASVIGAILKDQPPPISTFQPLTPPALDRLVATCLAKDPDERWQSARDLTRELKWSAASAAQPHALAPAVAKKTLAGNVRVAWLVAMMALIVAIATPLYLRPVAPESIVTRLDVVTPPTPDPFSFALSPDGRQLAFVAAGGEGSRLWVRSFDHETARPLVGTEGASYPFWSPDGNALGFFGNGKLKRVDVAGGAPQTLADVPGARGGTWNRDGVIVYAPQQAGLMRIAAAGGTPAALTHLAPGQGTHRWPQFLPDGRRFLFLSALGQPNTHGVYLGSLDGREPTRLLFGETAAVYSPAGYLLRVVQGVLVAHRFDAERGVVNSESVTVAQAVGTDDGTFHSAFSVGSNALAHRPGGIARRQLVWVDRTGQVTGTLRPPDDAIPASPTLAPDGRRVALNRFVQGNFDVWIIDIARGLPSRFTFDAANDQGAIWSPDASRLVFNSSRNGNWDLFEKLASGARDERSLLVTPQDKVPFDWSPDGRFLLYASKDPKTGSDLWALPVVGDGKPVPVVQTGADDREGQFSPDGRWVSYVSNESGIDEVYIRPFPDPGGKWQVSTNGGVDPRWRRDGRELFYLAPDSKLMAVAIQVGAEGRSLNPGPPVALFPTHLATGASVNIGFLSTAQYAVAPDGRFLMNVTAEETAAAPITIVLNWPTALKR
jgi:Tol biopolymer transport system component/predicted Ser/Thr protein kinase